VNGQVHAHITFSNTELAMGGHLEEGCRVLTFAVVVMAEAVDVNLTGWDRSGPL
jgi:predicted DNA-binding protein with PD1-like motif